DRGDHDHEVDVRDQGPLGRVVIVGAAAQEGGALLDPDDAGEGAVAPGDVPDQANEVTGDDGGAAQFTGPHRGDGALLLGALGDHRPPPPAVHGDHAGGDGVLMTRAVLGARARSAPAGPDADIALVVLPGESAHASSFAGSGCSIDSHIPTKSGSVFCVVPMFTIRRSGMRRPRIAPAVAMRWSS